MVWLPVFGILNVRTDVDACDCTLGLNGQHETVQWELNLKMRRKNKKKKQKKKNAPGLEPAPIFRLGFRSDVVATDLFPSLCLPLTAPLSCVHDTDNSPGPAEPDGRLYS